MADDQKLDAALEQGDQVQLNADEQRADPALDEMLLDQGLNSHRSAPELDADLVCCLVLMAHDAKRLHNKKMT
ncbi:hypothetical protein PF003_g11653 [Phytophthora fragariae]|nr:hypothetical protein PF003_g11653 [Phytophthora fragariae]